MNKSDAWIEMASAMDKLEKAHKELMIAVAAFDEAKRNSVEVLEKFAAHIKEKASHMYIDATDGEMGG